MSGIIETPYMAARRKLHALRSKQDGVELTSIQHPPLAKKKGKKKAKKKAG
jgi:hypothetical protein